MAFDLSAARRELSWPFNANPEDIDAVMSTSIHFQLQFSAFHLAQVLILQDFKLLLKARLPTCVSLLFRFYVVSTSLKHVVRTTAQSFDRAFPSRTASADCSSYLLTTVTPATVTYTATTAYPTTLVTTDISTIDITSTVTITPGVAKHQVTVTASDVPAYASAFSGAINLSTIHNHNYLHIHHSNQYPRRNNHSLHNSINHAPSTPVSTPFTLQIENTCTFYDGFDLEFDDCSGITGHPYLYYGGSDTSFVFGSDGFLHVESCFNVIAGTFQGNEPGPLSILDPAGPGTGGFVGAPCSDAGGYLACTGSNGETVFYCRIILLVLVVKFILRMRTMGRILMCKSTID
ncbi:hypothetical protein NA56DRAFT_755353 [Hyaloscypha hepaticicola]|uniref:Uncharacterized protein n=1 Tax=Hyaloscypha hepaticicola TaxID=2082293 RepID=A0A2J6PIQ0_9HELO|nr:hypothetical protein NA56DRAFT_755353 [Hyaloscypha hepaticicola]